MPGIHGGHRERMRERLASAGAEGMNSHELLEMLLYYVIPQRNTNPIAHALIDRFGSLDGVFSASVEALSEVKGIGERAASFLIENGRAAKAFLNAPLWEKEEPCYNDYTALGELFVSYFKNKQSPSTVALLLNGKMKKISLMELAPLDFDSAGVRAEKVIARAARLGATVVALAHNHPFGPAYPTHGDVVSMQVMEKDFSDCSIFLLEHYVVSGKSFVGFGRRIALESAPTSALCNFIRSKEEAAE